jgi:hypothetical protein
MELCLNVVIFVRFLRLQVLLLSMLKIVSALVNVKYVVLL